MLSILATEAAPVGGAFTIADESEFRRVINVLIDDDDMLQKASQTAGEYIKRNLGATERIYKHLSASDVF